MPKKGGDERKHACRSAISQGQRRDGQHQIPYGGEEFLHPKPSLAR